MLVRGPEEAVEEHRPERHVTVSAEREMREASKTRAQLCGGRFEARHALTRGSTRRQRRRSK